MVANHRDDLDIVITRVFDAPVELVWRLWTEAEHIARWFGPEGFTTRVVHQDFRVGGEQRLVMVGPDGAEYPCKGKYLEIVPHQRIVSTDDFGDDFVHGDPASLPQGMIATAEFEDLTGRTRLTLTIAHPTPEDLKKHADMGVVAGWRSSFRCLDAALEADTADEDRTLVVWRVIDAPRELVYDAFLDTTGISNWWGPVDFTTTTHSVETREGGEWRFTMHGPDGTDYENLIVYQELSRPERIAYEHPGGREVEAVCFATTVTLADDGGKTRVRLKMLFPSKTERDRVGIDYGAVDGLFDTVTRLAEHVGDEPAGRRLTMGAVTDTEVRFRRVIDAPRERVYAAMTSAESIPRWWGPRAITTEVVEHDLRVGGRWRFVCHEPGGVTHPFFGEFLELSPPERVRQTFCYDVEPFRDWPNLESVELVDRGASTLVLGTIVYPNRAARDGHLDSGMERGMGESYDRLEELVCGA
ncbi:MAG: SRPBCC family protein [Lacipirellulaceae bacterium]